jgi:DNA (cytosine-5)-methyltransferase 1
MTTHKAISLFSGCGGDTLGLERAGFKVVAFNEFKKPAIDTHTLNFPDSVLLANPKGNVSDITKVPDSVFEAHRGSIDIVFAGFPCQGFSSAGKRKAADPRNQMYQQFVRVVKATKPKFFIGENVTGLVSMKSGPKEDDPLVLTLIKKAFADIGYDLTYQVLEATDFGVPQKRKRIVLVGWDKSKFPNFSTESFWAGLSSPGQGPKLRDFVTTSMEGAFEVPAANVPVNFPNYALSIPQDAQPEGAPHPYVKLKASASDETYGGKDFDSLLSCAKRDSPVHSEIVDLDAPSKTIICTYDHQPRLLVGLRKPDGTAYVRTLLPDELKQIQGFPADFKLSGNKKDQVVQVGNAVPPPMIQAVANQLKTLLDEPAPKPKRKVRKPVVKEMV